MEKVVFLIGMGMSAFLDFSVGALIFTIVASGTGTMITIPYLLVAGAIALAPDVLHMLVARFSKKESFGGDHHETWEHWPIPMMVIGAVLGFVLGGYPLSLTAFLCLLFHYSHDMEMGNTGGIAFFAPFTFDYFAWWRGFYDPATSAMRRPENQLEPWIRRNWLRPSVMSVIEVSLGALALYIVAMEAGSALWFPPLLFFSIWIGAVLTWGLASLKK